MQNILYPSSCVWHDKSHHPLFFEMANNTTWMKNIQESMPLKMLKEEIQSNRPEIVILSSELAANFDPLFVIDQFKKNGVVIERMSILYSIRNIYDYYFSNYLQRVKDPVLHHKSTFAHYCNKSSLNKEFQSLSKWQAMDANDELNCSVRCELYSKENASIPFVQFIEKQFAVNFNMEKINTSVNISPSFAHHLLFLRCNQQFNSDVKKLRDFRLLVKQKFSQSCDEECFVNLIQSIDSLTINSETIFLRPRHKKYLRSINTNKKWNRVLFKKPASFKGDLFDHAFSHLQECIDKCIIYLSENC